MVLHDLGSLLRRVPALLQQLIKLAVAVGCTKGAQKALMCTNVVLLSISVRKLQRARFAASVRVMQQLDKESLTYLLNHELPLWVKFADWERGQHLQSFVTLVWPTFNHMICSIIKKEVEERLGQHGEFGHATFARLSLGGRAPTVLSVKGVPFQGEEEGGMLAMAIDIQIKWDGSPDIVMELSGIPGAAVAVRTCHVKGLLRVELSPIEEELPFLTGVSLTLLSRPELDFDIRVLGGDVMSLPALGSWLRSSVAGIVQERLVWPESLGWRWGPSWDRQQEAATGGGRAMMADEQQRRRQLPAPLGVLLVEVVAADLEPRRSTFLGRLKPVSSRVSLLLPAAADPAAVAGVAGSGSSSGAARAVLQKGLTAVQCQTCQPLWQHTFPFVVSSRHQVLHLLLSHKRSMRGVPLVKGMVQALGADMPLGSADVAVADILGEAAAREEWTVQQMLLEAAKLEVARAAAAAAAGGVAGRDSDADSMAGYESALDEDAYPPLSPIPSPSARSGSLGFGGFASAATPSDDDEAAGGAGSSGRGRVRVEQRAVSAAIVVPLTAAAAAMRQQQQWQARQSTPPPRAVSMLLEWRSGSSASSPGRALWWPDEQQHQQQQQRRGSRAAAGRGGPTQLQQPASTPPPPLTFVPSWRRSLTRSPSPERSAGHHATLGTAALLDPAALMQLQMEQQKPEPKWLSGEGVWVDVASANVLTLAGLLAQAAEPASDEAGTPNSPHTEDSEEEDGWLSRLQRYILGRGEGEEGEADEFAPTQAPLAGKVKLRLTWQPVELEAPPAPLLEEPTQQQQQQQQQQQGGTQAAAGQQQQQQQGDTLQPPAGGVCRDFLSPPPSARPSLDLQRTGSGSGASKAMPSGAVAGSAGPAAGVATPQLGGSPLASAAAAAAVFAAAATFVPQQGVLAVRVAHTKLEYVTGMSYPVLAVSIDRRPAADQVEAGVALLAGASPTKPVTAPSSAARSPAGMPDRSAATSSASMASVVTAAAAAAVAAGGEPTAQQAAQRWISMESTPGNRMGSLHWGQVFYIPTSLSEADCQEGRVVVELGEVASAARYTLFGPALYSLDAYDSFGEDVNVTASAGVPLRRLLQQRRLSCKARLKEATMGVGEADRLVVGEATVQLGWFPLLEQAVEL